MATALNHRIARIPHLASFLAEHPRALAGWGRKPSGQRAMRLAGALRRPFVLLEDGFLRSVNRDAAPLSLLVDDLGVYYDAHAPSRMEATIAAGLTPAQNSRATALITAWRAAGLSKYNHAAEHARALPAHYVLVADQCPGDLSVTCGMAGQASFAAMLHAALTDYPNHMVLVKTHPDIVARQRQGWFSAKALAHPRIRLIADGSHPVRLIRHAAAVYTVTSLIGFEALLHGRPLHCFGMPFYAGWGLSSDWLARPARRAPASIEALAHAALVSLARYVDPASGARWSAEQAIAYAARERAARFANVPAARPAFLSAPASAMTSPPTGLPCALSTELPIGVAQPIGQAIGPFAAAPAPLFAPPPGPAALAATQPAAQPATPQPTTDARAAA